MSVADNCIPRGVRFIDLNGKYSSVSSSVILILTVVQAMGWMILCGSRLMVMRLRVSITVTAAAQHHRLSVPWARSRMRCPDIFKPASDWPMSMGMAAPTIV
jgi:hypothetical protein